MQYKPAMCTCDLIVEVNKTCDKILFCMFTSSQVSKGTHFKQGTMMDLQTLDMSCFVVEGFLSAIVVGSVLVVFGNTTGGTWNNMNRHMGDRGIEQHTRVGTMIMWCRLDHWLDSVLLARSSGQPCGAG